MGTVDNKMQLNRLHVKKSKVPMLTRLPILILLIYYYSSHNSALKVKTPYVHVRSHTGYFLLTSKIPEVNNKCSSITKRIVYYVTHTYIQPFSMEVDY